MRSLPVPVSELDIEEMFTFADKNKDGKLSYKEFEVGILARFKFLIDAMLKQPQVEIPCRKNKKPSLRF